MIKTTEIMRKDWLYYKGKMNAFPFQVEQVTKKKIGYHAKPNDSRMHYLRPNEYFPIPLTEEFMQRNFPDSSEIVWFPLDTKPGFFNIYWEYPTFGEGELRLNIQYVHELQHILNICRIEKEIIL